MFYRLILVCKPVRLTVTLDISKCTPPNLTKQNEPNTKTLTISHLKTTFKLNTRWTKFKLGSCCHRKSVCLPVCSSFGEILFSFNKLNEVVNAYVTEKTM